MLTFLALLGCVQPTQPASQTYPGAPGFTSIPLNTLPGWQSDDLATALAAFVQSCKVIALLPPDHVLGGDGVAAQLAGQAGQWQNACNGAQDTPPGDSAAARRYFEAYFTAYAVTGDAMITGYFEPQYPGSKNLAPGFTIPLYARPADPVLANLPRAAIDHNALYRKAPVTAYLSNPVDAFMLQIYGEGRVLLPDGRILRVGFDGQNSAPYTPIGGILLADGDLSPGNVNFQSIYAWLSSHPRQATAIMEENARYVFLKPLGGLPDDEGAPGALGVPKTAGRSLAVDPAFIPLGMPVFLTTTDPLTGAALDRLTIAQDTDSGIRGAAAAKLFFGSGAAAEATAGSMHQPGRFFLLIPRPTASS